MTNKAKHEKGSPLRQVTCEFKFDLNANNPWDASKAGDLLTNLRDNYPCFEPVRIYDVSIGSHQVANNNHPPQQLSHRLSQREKYKYSKTTKSNYILIDKDSFSFNAHFDNEYTYTWESFKEELMKQWDIVSTCLSIEKISSIGLRYINHITLSKQCPVKNIIKQNGNYITPILINSDNFGFISKNQIRIDSTNSITIGFATIEDQNKNEFLLLDIDSVHVSSIDNKQQLYSNIIDDNHKKVEEVFFNSVHHAMKKGEES